MAQDQATMFRHLRDQIDRLLDRPPRTWESVVRRSQLFGDSPFPPERIILEVILQGRMQAVPHWNLHVAAVCGESMGAELVSTITLLAAEGRYLQEDLNAGLERWCFVCVLVPLESSYSGPDALVFEYMDSVDPWLPETLVQFQRIERPRLHSGDVANDDIHDVLRKPPRYRLGANCC